MTTLQLEHAISDFATWKAAFDRDPVDRAGSGVRAYRIHRPLEDPAYVVVDLEFDEAGAAERFRGKLERLWQSAEAAPALAGRPQVRIVETVEAHAYESAAPRLA
jgi:hypothetical protein